MQKKLKMLGAQEFNKRCVHIAPHIEDRSIHHLSSFLQPCIFRGNQAPCPWACLPNTFEE